MVRLFVPGKTSSRGRLERRRFPRRPPTSVLARRRSLFVMLAFVLAAGFGSAAGESPVSLGEVSGTTPSGEFAKPLRSALMDALDSAKLGRARDRFVLSASLVTLDTKKDGRSVKATAVVSMVLRREKEQTLHAMLRGNATAEAIDTTVDSIREDALRAAVESAMRRLPEAVGK
ncbi:MAG TPA: hypothetical protein VF103_01330 [Polyangiaceae bacterium]